MPKRYRKKVAEARMIAQEKLDAFHGLFAEVSRGLVSGESLTAKLNSLRYEAVFSKARRQREMHRRAARNADKAMDIDAQLRALQAIPQGLITPQVVGQDLTCALSGDTLAEVLEDTHDVMVFALRIIRPEHTIDAPTQVVLKSVCVGGYSHEAFVTTAGFTIRQAGAKAAHGGFGHSGDHDTDDDNTGLFLAADGQRMNGCLPM